MCVDDVRWTVIQWQNMVVISFVSPRGGGRTTLLHEESLEHLDPAFAGAPSEILSGARELLIQLKGGPSKPQPPRSRWSLI
jgi:hypothetical protein